MRSRNRLSLLAFKATLQSQTLSAVDKKTNKSAPPSTGTLLALGKQDRPPAETLAGLRGAAETHLGQSPPALLLYLRRLLRFSPGLLVWMYPDISALGKGDEERAVPWHFLLVSGWRWRLCPGPRQWRDAAGWGFCWGVQQTQTFGVDSESGFN